MPQGKQQYFTAGGIPLVGGKVYTYAAGTTTPLATYTTAAAGTPNTNPVILDSRGEASIFFSAANYKIVVKDSLDSTIWTQDNLPGDQAATILANLAASTGSSLVGYMPAGTGAVATTIQSKLRESVNVVDFYANGVSGAAVDPAGVLRSDLGIQAVADFCKANNKKLTAIGTFKLEAPLNLRGIEFDFSLATLNVAHAGLGVYIGGNSSNPNNPPQHLGAVTRSVGTDAYATPTVRCIGSSGQHVTVDYTGYLQLYADSSIAESSQSYAVQYSSFSVKHCVTLELTNNASTTGSPTSQYINENVFYLNAVQNLLINGTYAHNHNTFNDGNFELGTILFAVGGSNYVNNIRGEQGLDITFESGVKDCIVTVGWISSGHRYQDNAGLVIHNRGEMCAVQHLFNGFAPNETIAAFSYETLKNSTTYYNVQGVSNITVNSNSLVANAAFDQIYQSPLIPINGNENVVFEVACNGVAAGGGIRTKVTGYNASKAAITPAAAQVTFDGSPARQFDEYDTSINTNTVARFFITDSTCEYVRITVIAGGAGLTMSSFYMGFLTADIGLRNSITASVVANASGRLLEYDSGTWIPVDASGAGLTLTVNNAKWTRVANLVFIELDITYPATASGDGAVISGLPFTENFYGIGAIISNAAVPLNGLISGNQKVRFQTTGAAGVANSTLSGKYTRMSATYMVA